MSQGQARRGARQLERSGVGALHIPSFDLARRLGEIPSGRPVWVHCAAGYRAALAASLLARTGRRPVLIDDEWLLAAGMGLSTAA